MRRIDPLDIAAHKESQKRNMWRSLRRSYFIACKKLAVVMIGAKAGWNRRRKRKRRNVVLVPAVSKARKRSTPSFADSLSMYTNWNLTLSSDSRRSIYAAAAPHGLSMSPPFANDALSWGSSNERSCVTFAPLNGRSLAKRQRAGNRAGVGLVRRRVESVRACAAKSTTDDVGRARSQQTA